MRTAILVSLCATSALTAMAAEPPRPSPPLIIEPAQIEQLFGTLAETLLSIS